ncbi:hypothetical protein BJF78_30445 [Pseudonocardia sp. CNS-139]|nr:hypothetical protein BJF78_30445 [Pseudonocardia sp. CNS-139]
MDPSPGARALELARSPKARAALAALAGIDRGPPGAGHPAAPVVLAAELDGVQTEPGRLAAEVTSAVSDWLWNPLAQDQRAWLLDLADELALFAAEVLTWPAAGWWGRDHNPELQVVLGSSAPPAPTGTDLPGLADERSLPALPRTSVCVDDTLPAAELADPDVVSRVLEPVTLWRVGTSGARVYEVHGVADWMRLCDRYPRVHPVPDRWRRAGTSARRGLSPSWRDAAADWDGIHFSLLGVLTASDVAVTLDGHAVVAPSLDTEATFWLREEWTEPVAAGVWAGELPL